MLIRSLFYHVLVAFAVLVCKRSLVTTACRGYCRFLTFFIRDKIEIIHIQLAASKIFFHVILLWKTNPLKKLYLSPIASNQKLFAVSVL